MCWSGDTDCHEVSQAPMCAHSRRIWSSWDKDSWGDWDEASCKALMGSDAVVKTGPVDQWQGVAPQSREIPTATTTEACINANGICDTIGYTDTYGCFAEKPKGGSCWQDIAPIEEEVNESWGTWTRSYYFHEHWMEMTKHNWQPFCKFEKNFKSLIEAKVGCPADSTPQLSEKKEQRCQWDEMCFSKDITKSDCEDWTTMDDARNSYFTGYTWSHWDEDLELCKIGSSAFWDSKISELATFASTCTSFKVGAENWNIKFQRYFEEGRFHTEELCTAGVCDQDPGGWMGLTADECATMESCSNWNCAGCERNWDNSDAWSAPNSVCWAPTAANQTHCEKKFKGTWTNSENTDDDHYCLVKENPSPEECSDTYSQCGKMESEQCRGGTTSGSYDNIVTEHVLYCRPTKWA
ncbi:hypothetical protein TrVE_jg10811 [Triparma verrucosa]|uniref:Uncharacterized protein n=1 Tax=Triparma verrucosa TaxID=1606542 RepID=A0A9W7BLD6_9STRA|nr:hypothetical protein TrVE_jg10811 [Triparma verrucosa]